MNKSLFFRNKTEARKQSSKSIGFREGYEASRPLCSPTSPRMEPTVTSGQRRHSGCSFNKRTLVNLSRSLDSIKDQISQELSLSTQPKASHFHPAVLAPKPLEKEEESQKSTAVNSLQSTSKEDERRLKKHKKNTNSALRGFVSASSIPSLITRSNDIMLLSPHSTGTEVPKKELCGTPSEVTIAFNASEKDPTSHLLAPPSPSSPSSPKSKKLSDQIDYNGRMRMRRRMTVLSRNPKLNDKLLRKRALERQVKEKTMELEHIDNLLKKDNLTRHDLHDWLHEHPLMLKETLNLRNCERQLSDSDPNDDNLQNFENIAKQQCNKNIKKEENFFAKFFNYNNNNKNNISNTNHNNNNETEKVNVETKSRGIKLFSFSKAASSGRNKLTRSTSTHSVAISYIRRKLSTSSLRHSKDC